MTRLVWIGMVPMDSSLGNLVLEEQEILDWKGLLELEGYEWRLLEELE